MLDSPSPVFVERNLLCIEGILFVPIPAGFQIARYRPRQYQEQLTVHTPIGGIQYRVGLTFQHEWNPTVSIESHCEESVP
jgi:hypothetical protein